MAAETSLRAGVVWSAGGRGLSAVANLAALIIYARLLGPEMFGLFALCQAAAVILHNGLFHWLESSILRFLPTAASGRGDLQRSLFFGYLISFTLLAGFLAVRLLDLKNGLLPAWVAGLILPAILMAAGEAIAAGTAEAQRATGGVRRFAGLVLLRSLGALVLATVSIQEFGPTVTAAVYGHAAGCLIAGFVGLLIWPDTRKSPEAGESLPAIDGLREICRYGAPLSVSLLARLATQRVDRFVIAALLGVEAVGIYAVAYDLARRSIGVPLSLVNLVTYPRMAAAYDRGDKATVLELGRRNWLGLVLVGVPLAYGLMIVSFSAIPLIFGREFVGDVTVNIVALAALAILIEAIRSQHFDISLMLVRRTGELAVISLLTLVMAIVSVWFLTGWLGLSGAAAATCLTALMALALSVAVGWRELPMPVDGAQLLSVIILSAMMALGVAVFSLFVSGWFGLLGQIGVGAILFSIMALRRRSAGLSELTGWKI